MAAGSENKSMMIVWVVGAVLVVLGIYLAIPGTPAKKPMADKAPTPAAEKPMAKEEAPKPAAPAQPATPAEPTEKKPQ